MLRLVAFLTFLISPTVTSAQESILQDIGRPLATAGLPNGDILYPPLSYDGRYIAFHSTSTNLVDDDSNGVGDVFVLDRSADIILRISGGQDSGEPNGTSTYPSISGNGEYLVFTSEASNLIESDFNERSDVFLADIRGQTRTLVSRKADGTSAAGTSYNYFPSVSADGRFVVFNSDAPDLVAGDENGTWDVFLFDRDDASIRRISESSTENGNGPSMHAVISGDGRFIAYHSLASNLVTEDDNEASDIFLFNVQSGETTIISRSTEGDLGNARSERASISHDGSRISYSSDATNLVEDDTNGVEDVFLFDQATRETTRVSVGSDGEQLLQLAGTAMDRKSVMSPDGSAVAFRSGGGSLVGDADRAYVDVYLHRIDQGITERISAWPNGALIAGDSEHHALSYDASIAAFTSLVGQAQIETQAQIPSLSILGTLPGTTDAGNATISLGLFRNNDTGEVSFIGD